MSIQPLETLNQRSPAALFFRRFALYFFVSAAVGLLLYTGTAWNLFRPVVHKDVINKYAAIYHMDPLWIMAIAKVESRFEASARSPRGAVGLMQLLPSTAAELAPEVGLTHFQESDLKDPDINMHMGVHYLAKLQRMFPDDEVAVLSAYNAGPGITQQWRRGKPALDSTEIEYPETRQFVKQVQQTYTNLKFMQQWKHVFGKS